MPPKTSSPSGSSAVRSGGDHAASDAEAGSASSESQLSWLAKRRLAGDGPPYIKLGGAVRYPRPRSSSG